jgi:hypothetical protein
MKIVLLSKQKPDYLTRTETNPRKIMKPLTAVTAVPQQPELKKRLSCPLVHATPVKRYKCNFNPLPGLTY